MQAQTQESMEPPVSTNSSSEEELECPDYDSKVMETSQHSTAPAWMPFATAFGRSIQSSSSTEDETPTRPVTPRRYTTRTLETIIEDSALGYTQICSGQGKARARLNLLLEKERCKNLARKITCGACAVDLTTTGKIARLFHFNECWQNTYNRAIDNGLGDTCPDTSSDLESSDTETSDSGESDSASDSDSISEDTYGFACRNPSNCAFCSESMLNLHPIDAFHHRRVCLKSSRPAECPVCSVDLSYAAQQADNALEDILWHVHNCQHMRTLSIIDQDDFELLEARWKGRMQAIHRFINRQSGKDAKGRRDWSAREHQQSYRLKQSKGRGKHISLYLLPISTLREVETYDQHREARAARTAQEKLSVWENIERFRRSAFSIYAFPGRVLPSSYKTFVDETRQGDCKGTPLGTDNFDDERQRHLQASSWGSRKSREIPVSKSASYTAEEEIRKASARLPPGFELQRLESETCSSSSTS